MIFISGQLFPNLFTAFPSLRSLYHNLCESIFKIHFALSVGVEPTLSRSVRHIHQITLIVVDLTIKESAGIPQMIEQNILNHIRWCPL